MIPNGSQRPPHYRLRNDEAQATPTRIVLFEFPSMADAEGFYYGEVYQGLRTIRDECSKGHVVMVEGV